MFAVIETGGKQYLVKEGDVVKVEKINLEPNQELKLEKVLLLAEESGQKVDLGNPYLSGASVLALVQKHGRNKKIRVVKFKRKVRYRKAVGHRQEFSEIKITKIQSA